MIAIVSSSHYSDDERIYQRQICTLVEHGYNLIYYTKSSDSANLSNDRLIHLNFDKNMSTKDFINEIVKDLLKRNSISHLQIHETELLILLKIVKRKMNNIFTIYDIHENMNALYRTFSKRSFLIKELAILKRNYDEIKMLKFVDQIILANPPIKKLSYHKLNIPILVLENYVEKKYLIKKPLLNDNLNLIYHGHLGAERGIEDLVLAMEKIVQKYPDIKLLLLGSFRTKQFENKIKKLIVKLLLGNNIIYKKQVSYKNVWKFLRKSSIGIIPFRKNPLTENCIPTKLFEMMASSHQIVTTDLAPIRCFVSDSVFWAKPNNPISLTNAIISCVESVNDKAKIEKNLRLIKNKYNWDLIKNNYINLFK